MLRVPLITILIIPFVFAASALDYKPTASGGATDSPYAVWAESLDSGTISCALVAPRFSILDAQSFMDRFDVNLKVVPIWDEQHLGYDPAMEDSWVEGFSEAEVLASLEDVLANDLEVLILARFPFDLIPKAVGQRLAARVHDGVGLVLIEFGDGLPLYPEWLDALVAAGEEVPADALLRGVVPPIGVALHTLRVGKGRISLLRYEAFSALHHSLVPDIKTGLQSGLIRYGNALSLVARTVRWSARQDALNSIGAVRNAAPQGPDPREIPSEGLSPEYLDVLGQSMTRTALWPFQIELTAPAEQRYEVAVGVRNPGAERQYPIVFEEKPWPEGSTIYPVNLRLGPGSYFIDVWLMRRGRVIDWFTEQVTLRGWPELVSVVPDVTYLESGGTLWLNIDLRPTHATFSTLRAGTVYVRALDAQGNEITNANATVYPDTTTQPISLTFPELNTPLVKVEVYAIDGESSPGVSDWTLHRVSRTDLNFPVLCDMVRKPFELVATIPTLEEINARAITEILHTAGFSSVSGPASKVNLYHAARIGVDYIPELFRFGVPEVGGLIRQPCLTNPAFLDIVELELREGALDHMAGASRFYSLGVGNALCRAGEPSCQSPTCISAFQERIKSGYSSLDALNAAWGTSLASWDDITPELDLIPSRMEFEASMGTVFTGVHAKARSTVKQIDPQGRVGFIATRDGRGFDWYGLAGAVDYVGVPVLSAALLAKARSYQAEPGSWMAVAPDYDSATAYHAWRAALYQLGGLWCQKPYGSAIDAASTGLILPSGKLADDAIKLSEAQVHLSGGVAALLQAAQRETGGVVIFESRRSRHFEAAAQSLTPDSRVAEEVFATILTKLGFQAEFISEELLIRGGLARQKVLILPAVLVLSPAERNAIMNFIAQGGVVIAGLLPGTHDELGIPGEGMSEIFGLTSGDTVLLEQRTDHKGNQVIVDVSVKAENSYGYLGDVPVGISYSPENNVGKGGSLLLNWCPAKEDDDDDFVLKWISSFFSMNGVVAPGAKYGKKLEPSNSEWFKMRYGEAELLALLVPPTGDAVEMKVELPKGAVAYDLIGKSRLKSRRSKVQLGVGQGGVALCSILPYEVSKVHVSTATSIMPGVSSTVLVNVETEKNVVPGKHLVAVQLYDTDEKPMMDPVLAECPNGTGSLVFSLNFEPGNSPATLHACDLLSGVSTILPLKKSEKPGRITR